MHEHHSFVNRDAEVEAFRKALELLHAENQHPPVIVFHGASGMGKSWLMHKCRNLTEKDKRKSHTLFVDCNRSDMTLEVLFNEIHTRLESDFPDAFDRYIDFLEKIEEIESEVEEEAHGTPDNAQKTASFVASVAGKAVAATVPGATIVGEQMIGKGMELAVGGLTNSITSLRRKFARKKLDREKYRLFLKDLQSEQAQELAAILNKIAEKQKLVLFIDRFEKLAMTPNTRSDRTFYEYWRDDFVNRLSQNVLLVQGGRMDLGADYSIRLQRRPVRAFQLQNFTEKDIAKILDKMHVLQRKMQEYQGFIRLMTEKTLGFPVAVGLVNGHLQTLQDENALQTIREDILEKETGILEQSINWFLDNANDAHSRDTVYKLAICCKKGKINKQTVAYIFDKSDMTFPRVEEALRGLSQQHSFIDCIEWTMHETARGFILRHLKLKAPAYVRQISREMRDFSQRMAEQAQGGQV